MMGLTLFDKVWNKHVLHGNEGEPQLLYRFASHT